MNYRYMYMYMYINYRYMYMNYSCMYMYMYMICLNLLTKHDDNTTIDRLRDVKTSSSGGDNDGDSSCTHLSTLALLAAERRAICDSA